MYFDDFIRHGRTVIIAEVGINHNGDFSLAKEMLHAAADCDVDVVKFQNFDADKLILKHVLPRPHLRHLYPSQHARFRSVELSGDQLAELAQITGQRGKIFMSTPSDPDGVDLIDPLVPVHKIGSDDLVNIPLIRHTVAKDKTILLSTGLATTAEIDRVAGEIPKDRLVLLHCVSKYPTPPEAANLRAIGFLHQRYGVPVGYSDHTIGTTACLAAVGLGAILVEKHFTLDKNQDVGDHRLSADPQDMARLVREIRELEKMLTVAGRHEPGTEEELNNSRKSLVTLVPIAKGTALRPEAVMALRPGGGISPLHYDAVIGKKAARDLPAETILEESDLV